MFTKLRELLGLETNQERLFRYEELNKSFDEVSKQLDSLADIFFTERKRYINRLQNPDNVTIQKSIESRFNNFLEVHKEEVRNARKEYFKIEKEVKKLEKSLGDEITNRKTYNKIKKAYKSGLLSLEDFNEAAKRITKEGKTKYADFLLFNEKGELLLLKRSKWEDDLKGSWVIPGGHVDLGEEFEAAALRELWEESGFRPNQYKNVGNYIDDNVEIEYYQGAVNTTEQSPLLDFNETSEYRWICLDDIDDYEMIFNMRENIKRILGLPDKPHKVTIRKSEEEVEKSLYKQAISELYALINKRNSLIEKSGDSITVQFLDQIIEKAVKDISKLNKIKKLIYRDGKLIFATYYVKTGNEIEDKKKIGEVKNINIDIEEGKKYSLIYGKDKKVEGIASGFCFSKPEKTNYFCLVDKDGKKNWLNSSKVKSIKYLEDELNQPIEKLDENGFKFIKDLGGSTGAKLVEDKYGNKFVKKTGADSEHILAEHEALKIYKYFGVKVPHIHKFDYTNGILYTESLQDALPIDTNNSWTKNKIADDFAVDALLANWDVIGLDDDNILQTVHGLFRVDVGGCLNKRAQGGDKYFGEEVKELETLLDPNINPKTAKIFKDVDIQEQLKNLIEKYDSGAFSKIESDFHISYKTAKAIERRIDYLRTKINEESPKEQLEKLNYDGKLYDLEINEDDDLYSKDIVGFYDKLNDLLKFDEDDLNKLKSFDNRYESESRASKNLVGMIDDRISDPIVQIGLKRGVTYRELLAINDYTGSDYSVINSISSKVFGTETGNFNFDKNKFGEPRTIIKTDTKYISFNKDLDILRDIISTINKLKEQGKSTTLLSENDKARISTISQNLYQLKSDHLTKKTKLTSNTKETIDFLSQTIENINDAILHNEGLNDIKIPSNFIYGANISYHTNEVDEKGIHMNTDILQSKSYNLSKLKLICSGLRKLEGIKNKNFYIQGLFNRGISTSRYDHPNGNTFDIEHKDVGEYVVHGWGGSSGYKDKGFDHGDTLMEISGTGVYIAPISQHKSEKEVLNRPFSLFKINEFQEKSNNGKKIVKLLKVV